MTAKTLEALEASVAHWERMRDGKHDKAECPGVEDCALCGLFFESKPRSVTILECEGCPVKERTGKRYCHGTPYAESNSMFYRRLFSPLDEKNWIGAANAEIEFLKSLLPKWFGVAASQLVRQGQAKTWARVRREMGQ